MVSTTVTHPQQEKPPVITNLGKVSPSELSQLKNWLKHIDHYMIKSVSTYAQGRRELHLRHFVKLAGKDAQKLGDEVTKVPDSIAKKYQSELIESIGERLLPGFHEGLVLHYPKGTLIKPHRDSRAYDKDIRKGKGAASVNIIGNAKFLISHQQSTTNLEAFELGEGDCIRFDNNQPHAVARVQADRWCVCFFYLKEEYLPKPSEQLALFPSISPVPSPQSPITDTRIPRIYTSYYDGRKIGKVRSISLGVPKGYTSLENKSGQLLFTPSPQILNRWKASSKNEIAQENYTRAFNELLHQQSQAVDEWLEEVLADGKDITICCYEEAGKFCHRHLVGKYIATKRPDMWGGEVETEASELEKLATDPKFLQALGHPDYQPKTEKLMGADGMPFTKPRYTWVDQEALARWWNPYGEEISYIKNLATGEKRFDVHSAKNIPEGWGAVLAYGGRAIPAKDLIFVGGE